MNIDGIGLFVYTISVVQEEDRFGQSAANVLLCQADGASVGDTQVCGQFTDEELAQYLVAVESRRRGDGCGSIWGLPYVALEWLKQPAEERE